MARRLFNGRRFSENGWPYVDENSCRWVQIAADAQIQIQDGIPATAMGAFARDYDAYIEPIYNPDSACWTPGNSVATSNHPGATAMDLRWDSHPFQQVNTFNADQRATINELLDWYEGMIFWGGRWNSPKDEMHWQMGYDTYDQNNDRPEPKCQDFINRKIRTDGFSKFRRSGEPAPPPTNSVSQADVLARATGISFTKATAILPQVSFALVKANCTNPRRIAAALAQWVIESGHFVYTEEIASGPESEERWKYKGRTWVQLTWVENYRGFSVWCHSLGLVPTPDYFVVRPRELADQKWAALGPAYWWAIKYPRINEYADRGDIDNVSKWVNAPAWVDNPNKHANGEKKRRDAYNLALALGDQLLTLTSAAPPQIGDGFLMALSDQQQIELYNTVCGQQPSLSPFRPPGPPPTGSVAQFVRWSNGGSDFQDKKDLAVLGHQPTLDLLNQIAVLPDLDRQADAALARNVLAAAKRAWAAATPAAPAAAAPVAVDNSAALAAANAEIARLRDDNARLRAEAAVPPSTAVALNGSTEGTLGQRVGQFVDAVGQLNLAAASPIEERATLAASIKVLDTKNGSQL